MARLLRPATGPAFLRSRYADARLVVATLAPRVINNEPLQMRTLSIPLSTHNSHKLTLFSSESDTGPVEDSPPLPSSPPSSSSSSSSSPSSSLDGSFARPLPFPLPDAADFCVTAGALALERPCCRLSIWLQHEQKIKYHSHSTFLYPPPVPSRPRLPPMLLHPATLS